MNRILERLLANGPLTAWPHRPSDARFLVELAALRFAAGRAYREAEVNAILGQWLATFSAPFGIDHVTLRRELVDARLLMRDSAGAGYRVDEARRAALASDPAYEAVPAEVLSALRAQREARKRAHAG